jgi:hypothetical protein
MSGYAIQVPSRAPCSDFIDPWKFGLKSIKFQILELPLISNSNYVPNLKRL